MLPGLVWGSSPTRDAGTGINIATPSILVFGINNFLTISFLYSFCFVVLLFCCLVVFLSTVRSFDLDGYWIFLRQFMPRCSTLLRRHKLMQKNSIVAQSELLTYLFQRPYCVSHLSRATPE